MLSRTGVSAPHNQILHRSESDEHRFRFEQDAPDLHYALLNLIFQANNIARLRVSAVHQTQSVLARDSRRTRRIALGEARMLHQPGRGDFMLRGLIEGISTL